MIDRDEVAKRHGIPELADQLHGDTPEAVEAFAAALAALKQREREPHANALARALEAKQRKHSALVRALHGGSEDELR